MADNIDEMLGKVSGPLGKQVLAYNRAMSDGVIGSKKEGFTNADWAPLAALVDTGKFVRVGNFREAIRWDQYLDLLTMWGSATDWDITIRRITEGDGYVIQEAAERAGYPDRVEEYNSVAVYEFDENRKLIHLEIYLSKVEDISSARSHQWNLDEVGALPA